MSRRRTLRALVLLTWCAGPALASLPAATADPHDKCAGHVCHCQRKAHCPPKRPAAKNFNQMPAASRSAGMTSRCNHDSDSLPVGSRSDTTIRPAQELGVDIEWQAVAATDSGHLNAGHTRLDPQPPRAAS